MQNEGEISNQNFDRFISPCISTNPDGLLYNGRVW